MSIYRVDPNQTVGNKISNINDMLLEVNGKAEQGRMNKYELDQLFTDLGVDRKYTRETALGHSASTYANWTHVQAESGYSIWKYALTDYVHNLNNKVYMDDRMLVNKGIAGSETATTFATAYTYTSPSYTNVTTEAGTEAGTEFNVSMTSGEYLYLGAAAAFGGAKFEFQTRGSNYTLAVQYWKSSGWTTLTYITNGYVDNTSNFESDGTITWNLPSDWISTSVNGTSRYWVRIYSTTTPVTTAKAYYIIPYNSVVALLALSSTEVQNEDWAWCSYAGSIYVTIRNTGAAAYEGNYFISSSSSSTNKQNFFVSNHSYKLDYENFPYSGTAVAVHSGTLVGDMVCITDEYTFDKAVATSMAKKAVGVLQSSGCIKYFHGLVRNVNTDGSSIVPGNVLYLSTTAGKVSKNTPATGGGRIIQKVGVAIAYPNSGNVVDMLMQLDVLPTNA